MRTNNKYRSFVVKQGTREKFLRIFDRNDWLLYGEEQRTDNRPYEIIWCTDDEETLISYIQDFIVHLDHFLIRGKHFEQVSADILDMLKDYLYTLEEIVDLWDKAQTRDEKIQAIYRAGVGASSDFDDAIYNIFQQAVSDPDPEVRRATVWAMSYIAWPKIIELVTTLASSDSDASVRETAASLQKTYRDGIGIGYSSDDSKQ